MTNKSAHTIITNRQGKVLLTQRWDVPLWVIPGGHINKRESPKAAAIRELCEETGIKIRKINLIAKYYDKKGRMIKYLFCGKLNSPRTLIESEEVKQIKWVDCHKLPTPISLYETQKINDFLIFNNKVIIRSDFVDKRAELLKQLKTPVIFIWLLFFFLKNQLTTKTFKF